MERAQSESLRVRLEFQLSLIVRWRPNPLPSLCLRFSICRVRVGHGGLYSCVGLGLNPGCSTSLAL